MSRTLAEGEGGLEAPLRHPIAFSDPEFNDKAALDKELRRVFDVCHGCRRCFNLCDSFPRLFDAIDDTPIGEVEGLDSAQFGPILDSCTLCDMCFMTKCPFVPPHEFDIDFPHLVLRYRAVMDRKKRLNPFDRLLRASDLLGKLATRAGRLTNFMLNLSWTRRLVALVMDIDRRAILPPYEHGTLTAQSRRASSKKRVEAGASAPQSTRQQPAENAGGAAPSKVFIYASCFGNYNDHATGKATQHVLQSNGIESEIIYLGCCGMPLYESGDVRAVARAARRIAKRMRPYVESGLPILSLTPSCSLMLRQEWSLLAPEDENVKALAASVRDVSEFLASCIKSGQLRKPESALSESVSLHLSCHARALNHGRTAETILSYIEGLRLNTVERCSGHGGVWGYKKDNFDTAMKVGKTSFNLMARPLHEDSEVTASSPSGADDGPAASAPPQLTVVSECPLAGRHLMHGMELAGAAQSEALELSAHPVVLLARAYGMENSSATRR